MPGSERTALGPRPLGVHCLKFVYNCLKCFVSRVLIVFNGFQKILKVFTWFALFLNGFSVFKGFGMFYIVSIVVFQKLKVFLGFYV